MGLVFGCRCGEVCLVELPTDEHRCPGCGALVDAAAGSFSAPAPGAELLPDATLDSLDGRPSNHPSTQGPVLLPVGGGRAAEVGSNAAHHLRQVAA